MSGHGRKRGGHAEHEEEGGSERWLVTYADMLTLLLVLFIVLYSISKVNTSKLSQLRASLNAALGGGQNSVLDGSTGLGNQEGDTIAAQLIPNPAAAQQMNGEPQVASQNPASSISGIPTPSTSTGTSSGADQAVTDEVDQYKKIEQSIAAALAANNLTGKAQYSITKDGLVVTLITDSLVFPANSATLLPGGETILQAVTPPLVGITNDIKVNGYTNQVVTSTDPYPSGWELSSARASSVVRYMTAHNVPASRLQASGFSDQDPLYPASDPRSITGNRRVEIVVLSNLSGSENDQLAAAGQS